MLISKNNHNYIKLGIAELDEIVNIPSNSIIMVAGKIGTGKQIFSMQYLYYGANILNEPGLYISFEDEPEEIINYANLFGWDFQMLINEKKILISKPENISYQSLIKIIEDEKDRLEMKRIVINSFSVITSYFNDIYSARKLLSDLKRKITKIGCSCIIISDIREGDIAYSLTGYEEFVADGVIILDIEKDKKNNIHRTLFIRKMKKSKHPLKKIYFDITSTGIKIK